MDDSGNRKSAPSPTTTLPTSLLASSHIVANEINADLVITGAAGSERKEPDTVWYYGDIKQEKV
jgi:hypothetical protein